MSSFRMTFAAAVLIMLAMGILYLWGIFLIPLEAELELPRDTLSIVSSAALLFFTLGVMLYDTLLRSLRLQAYLALAFALAAGGHLLFGLMPSFTTLLVGYGVVFAVGAGLGYGLALALASRAPAARRGVVISLVVSAFALSGVILGAVLPVIFADVSSHRSFVLIALGLVLAWACAAVLLRHEASFAGARMAGGKGQGATFLSPMFLKLGFAFFVFNFAGLMMVAHCVGLITAAGISQSYATHGLIVLNLSYITGALAGGRLGEQINPKSLLLAALALTGGGFLLLAATSGIWAIGAGIALIGFVFGSAASFTPVLVGRFWGSERISQVYGAMMFAYGAAGILAPWLTAVLFASSGSYAHALWVGLAMCGLGGLGALSLAPEASSAQRAPI